MPHPTPERAMRKLNHRRLENQLRHLQADVAYLLENVQHPRTKRWVTRLALVVETANDAFDDGIKAIRYDAVKRGGADAWGPEAWALLVAEHPDLGGHARNMTRFDGTIGTLADLGDDARTRAGQLHRSPDERDRAASAAIGAAVGAAGSGNCSNCGRWCPGTRNDRLKAGRCWHVRGPNSDEPTNCYDYHRLHGTDRPTRATEAG